MKLLVVVPYYYPATRYGGPVTSIGNLCGALSKLGTSVTVYTTNSDGPFTLSVPCGVEHKLGDVRVFYFETERPRGYFRSPALRRALRRHVADFDVVYAPTMYSYTTAVAARESLRQQVPYVLSPRGMLDNGAIAMKGTLKKRLYLALVERTHITGAAGIHFTSEGEKLEARGFGRDRRAFVVPNGIDIGSLTTPTRKAEEAGTAGAIPADRKVVLFLGRLNYIKGLDLLARAWPQVISLVPDAHLVIAGADDDGLLDSLARPLERAGCRHTMSYAGIVHGDEKLALLRRAEVLVSPSYLESFGNSIVEAMACARPVIVTDRVNIAREIAAAGAGLVTPCDSGEIARALTTLLTESALAIEWVQPRVHSFRAASHWKGRLAKCATRYSVVVQALRRTPRDLHSRPQCLSRRLGRLSGAGRRPCCRGRGGAVSPAQTLGRFPGGSDPILPRRGRRSPRGHRTYRNQPGFKGEPLEKDPLRNRVTP